MLLKRVTLTALAMAVLGSTAVLVACGGDKGEAKLTSEQQKETAARLAPEGEVALASAVAAPPTAGGGARSGEEVVDAKCGVCHASGAGGAPKTGSVDDWAPRIAKGVDVLYASAVNGLNGMPPKGLCMDCSPEEIHAAVDYMLEKSK